MCYNTGAVILNMASIVLTTIGVIILLATYTGPMSEGRNIYQGQCYVTNSSIQNGTECAGQGCAPIKFWRALFEVTIYPEIIIYSCDIEHLAAVVRIDNTGWVTDKTSAMVDQQKFLLYSNYSCAYNTKALSMTYDNALISYGIFIDFVYLGANAYDLLRSSFISGNIAGTVLTSIGVGSFILYHIIFFVWQRIKMCRYASFV